MIDSLQRALASSKVTGAAVGVVDAKDEAGNNFYQRYGFKPFVGVAHLTYLVVCISTKTLRLWGKTDMKFIKMNKGVE